MSVFRVNTNVSSLQSREFLRQTSESQGRTISRVTSGLRIVSSGDDAAGLAVANSLRSDQTTISQGIRNANDGLSTLQTLDGGINNIGRLLDRWKLTRTGRGQAVLIAGEPGIGKSRILRAFQERLDPDNPQVAQFQCSPYHVNSALYPVIDHLERALDVARNDSDAARLRKIEAALVGRWHRSPRDCQLIARLLGVESDLRYGPLELTPQRQKEDTLRLLVDLLAGLARERGAFIVFEDVHWADPTTLELLEILLRRVESQPLLALVSFRPEFIPAWTGDHLTLVPLARLSRTESAQLVERITGGKPVPADLVEQIVEKTDGVPLFLEELTRAVLESGLVEDAGSHFRYVPAVDRMTIPTTLRDSLMARLDRLIPVKEIAQIGAVIGREFGYDLVAAVSPMRGGALEDALGRLVSSQMVFQRGAIPQAVYTFKHALVQDAAYDSLLKAKRQELHARIAAAIQQASPGVIDTEPELLAHHYTAAGVLASAIPLWQRAGEFALQRMALHEAIAHLERALRLNHAMPTEPERDALELRLRALLGTAWMALRGWPAQEVVDHLEPALGLARRLGHTDPMATISTGLWAHVLVRGRIAESLPLAENTIDEGESAGDDELQLVGHAEAMISRFWMGHLDLAAGHGHRILQLYDVNRHRDTARKTNFDPRSALGLYAAHYQWMLGYPDQALATLLDKERHAREIGHAFDLGFALTTGSHALEYRGEPEALMQRVEEAERLGRESSVPFISEVRAQVMRGVAMLRAGDCDGARRQITHGMGMWSAHGSNIWNPYLRALIAEAEARSGEPHRALALLDESIEQANRPGWEERAHLAEILRLKGWVLRGLGRIEEAFEVLCVSLEWARHQQARSWELRTATTMAEILADQSRVDAAVALLRPVFDWFTEGFGTLDLRCARAFLDRHSAPGTPG
jgi:tetratricopeptide (TPR) repeat protein